jgi:hypothetical protein
VEELGGALAHKKGEVRDGAAAQGSVGVKPVAVFRFLSEDWSPWIALVRMRKRWPGLRFDMRRGYLESGSRGNRRRAQNVRWKTPDPK